MKEKEKNIKISVRNLVEFILRSGNIDNRFAGKGNADAMQQGIRLHRKIQGKMNGNYQAEVPLKVHIKYEEFTLTVEGRADGIECIYDENHTASACDCSDKIPAEVMIDEIKCMYKDVMKLEKPDILHEAQAMCYAYMYLANIYSVNTDSINAGSADINHTNIGSVNTNLIKISIQITYVNIETEEVKRLKKEYSFDKLSAWFSGILKLYEKWVKFTFEHSKEKIRTAKSAEFPFSYRPGQKEIAVSVYKAVLQKKELFIQAPTGVGKTMSVIFPAVKAAGEGLVDKIFYLTAKTITGQVAQDSFKKLRENGLAFHFIVITAKDKMCVKKETKCNPDYCERAKGHFDRINDAVYDIIIHEQDITREIILSYADKHQVCPYELSLDVSNFADAVICDYNYAFDPTVSLKRYFSGNNSERYLFLVDESHNLVERARAMYSADLKKEDMLAVKKIIAHRDNRVTKALEDCNRTMLAYKRMCDREYVYLEEIGDFIMQLEKLYGYMEQFLDDYREFEGRDEVLDFYFSIIHFLNMYDCTFLKDEGGHSYYEICGHLLSFERFAEKSFEGAFEASVKRGISDEVFLVRLMCINPSANLKACMEHAVSTVFFSATLLPVNYYKLLLSGDINDYAIYIDSPFNSQNRKILVANDVSSKYTRRTVTEYRKIAEYIEKTVSAKKGNYMIFAPSYRFMEEILKEIERGRGDYEIAVQKQSMVELEREEFLSAFHNFHQKTFLSFCVMGGIFSEGIDLTEDKLIGSIIIGAGLPQVCMEKEVIKTYFEESGRNGFDYAYLYPGINKVLQAAGRVIRTENDKGIIILLDDRFLRKEYSALFPREWHDREVINLQGISQKVEDFWKKTESGTENQEDNL